MKNKNEYLYKKEIFPAFTQNQAVLQLEEYKQPYWPSTKQVLIMISLESKEINLINNSNLFK